MMSVSLRFSGMSTLRIKCVFSYENVVFIPQLVVVYMERVRGERPTASSPGEALQLLKAISCHKGLTSSFRPFIWTSQRRQKICFGLCLGFKILFVLVQVGKIREHSPGVLVFFCWEAVGFRAFQVWGLFFWAEVSDRAFSVYMAYVKSMREPCPCKQGRSALSTGDTIQKHQTNDRFMSQVSHVSGACLPL